MEWIEKEEVDILPEGFLGNCFLAETACKLKLPLFTERISAGFPSPADDYMENRIDLNKQLISHPSATFYIRVKGSSMIDAGIRDGDMLVVDRALEARNNDIVVSVLDGEFTVKRVRKEPGGLFLVPENPEYQPIQVTPDNDFKIWGVVSYIIHKAR